MTARDLITGSLRIIGAISTGEAPSAAELQDAISVLNDMLDSWSTNSLAVNARVPESFTLVPGQQSFTMGPTGNFDTSRPLEIEQAAIQVIDTSPTVEIPLHILTHQEWADELVKAVTSTIPTKLHLRGTSPLETLEFWPIPSAANKVILYSRKPLASVSNGNTVFTLPPGYPEAIRYNLAKRLAGEYGKAMSEIDLDIARESFANVKRQNIKPRLMKSETVALASGGKRFNIITGE